MFTKANHLLPIAAFCLMTASCNTGKQQAELTAGIQLANLDTTALPGTDFYQYACGGWMKNNPIPAEYSQYGSFTILAENNRKQIKLLEEAAHRLYKEWFIDLRFPGHEHTKIVDGVPEGWEKCSLGDVIEFDPKVQLTKDRVKQFVPMSALSTSSMVLDMAEFSEITSNSGSKFQNGDTLLARITPCLENGKTAFVHGIQSSEGAVGSTEYIVMRSKRLNQYMVYLHARTDGFRQSAINSMSGSDGRQRVKADKLKVLSYLLPPATVVNQFGQFAAPIFELVFDLNEQTFHAAQARDRLLPRFMSGLLQV